MKDAAETMKILSAYDLTESLRGAAELAGCSHHTVARLVRARDAGQTPGSGASRPKVTDVWAPKIEEWVEASTGRIRADVVHAKLTAMGYTGSERSTRRAVAEVKAAWRAGKRRVHRPWITEPGAWPQYDFGDGPAIDGAKTVLFVAWLAWSRYRIVIALRDRTAPSVFAALDRCFRLIGGAPTYVLTDNEKTVTVSHVAGVPVRNQATVAFARHYGVEVLTCQPADPAAKGGVENAVKLAKADLVPKDTNLRDQYASFAELEAACAGFMAMVNSREHRVTRRRPDHMLAEETSALHRIPATAHTVAYGVGRKVPENTPMVSFENAQYSVPAHLLGAEVFVRHHGTGPDSMVVIMHAGAQGPVEVARHRVARPGSPAIDDAHFPGHETDKVPGDYTPVPRSAAEAEFLAIGAGARTWLVEAAAAGTSRIGQKMAEAVTLAKLAGTDQVDRALGVAAVHQRFAHGDLASLLTAAGHRTGMHTATEERSLTQGTAGWAGLGTSNTEGAAGEHPHPEHRRTGAAGRFGGAVAAPEDAPRPRYRRRGTGHRPGPTLGAGRGPQGPAGRGDHRSGPIHARRPAQGRRVPHRQDLHDLGSGRLLDPGPDPAVPAHPGMALAQREPRGLRPLRHRQDLLPRGPGPAGRGGGQAGGLVHPGGPRGDDPGPPAR